MPDSSVPPLLKVIQTGASSYIPVFELELSGGTVTKLSPIRVRYNPTASTGVAASRVIATTAPLAGGGDLSIDRTHTLDTAAVVTSGRTISTLYPISGGGDFSINRTFAADTAFLVTSARTMTTVAPLSGGGDLSVNRVFSLVTGGAGTVLISSGGVGFVASQNLPRLTTIRIPMALSTIQPTSGNAYWVGQTSATIDIGAIQYVDSGTGLASYYCLIPNNLAPSPLWNLHFYHAPDVGAGGSVVLSVSAMTVSVAGSIPGGALTNVMAAVVLSTRAAGVLEISTGSATNFDATLTLNANDYFTAQIWRLGGSVNDTVSAAWNLFGVELRTDVVT